ncbi:serine/threonine-protein kinase cbk1 [Peziza echinospora]|nr:serine/threonine-protein kinase cbk1 [Peziza echinospora]
MPPNVFAPTPQSRPSVIPIFAPDVAVQERRFLREEWRRKETAYLRALRGKSLNIGNYEIVKVIGKGAFGVVKLVRERSQNGVSENGEASLSLLPSTFGDASSATPASDEDYPSSSKNVEVAFVHSRRKPSRVYALKVMQKADMLVSGQEGHLRAERDFLVASQGSKYLVMEYLIGGDFLALLIKKTVLDEEETRFYVAEMICCIEEAHALGYIHRDVKPDNFLFTSQGHLKLCDFGLAFSGHQTHDSEYLDHKRHGLLEKVGLTVDGDTIDRKEGKRILQTLNENITSQIPRDYTREASERPSTWLRANRGLARSVVDIWYDTQCTATTSLVRGEAYDGRCDWWSLGIIIYECLYGFTPFYSGNRTETRQKILNWRTTLTFPSEPRISSQAYHLVASLLCERQHRITSRTYAMNDNMSTPRIRQGVYRNNTSVHHGRHTSSINHVLPHDGVEIKSHPFFRGIKWHKLHTMKAPFIPEGLSGDDDTKYFDEESYDSSEGSTSPIELSPQIGAPTTPLPDQADALQQMPDIGGPGPTCPAEVKNEIKVVKRPRDKLLRDAVHGPELLDLRKETLDGSGAEVTGKRRVTLAGCAGFAPHTLSSSRVGQVDGQVARDKKNTAGAGEFSGTTIDAEESVS